MYYEAQVKHVTKPRMVDIVKNLSQVHAISQNNIIFSDFNFADADMDKGKGMGARDTMIPSVWEGWTPSAYNVQKNKFIPSLTVQIKVGVAGFMSTKKMFRMYPTTSIV